MKKKILIVMANYYQQISRRLLNSTKEALQEPFDLISVPGVFEIPVTIAKNIKKMILITRSKKKVIGLEGYGIKITKQEIIK